MVRREGRQCSEGGGSGREGENGLKGEDEREKEPRRKGKKGEREGAQIHEYVGRGENKAGVKGKGDEEMAGEE